MTKVLGVEGPTNPLSAIKFRLKQKSDNMTGTVISQTASGATHFWALTGLVRDAYFSALLSPLSPNMVDAGTCLLRVFHEGEHLHMSGSTTAVVGRESKIGTIGIEMRCDLHS